MKDTIVQLEYFKVNNVEYVEYIENLLNISVDNIHTLVEMNGISVELNQPYDAALMKEYLEHKGMETTLDEDKGRYVVMGFWKVKQRPQKTERVALFIVKPKRNTKC